MTNNNIPGRDDLDELRRLGTELGMPGEIRPEDHGIQLESASDFVSRMQSDEQSQPESKSPVLSFSHWNRRTFRFVAVAAATVGVALAAIFTPWSQPTAVADTPAILSFQFAPATDIAYAPGEDARQILLDLAEAAAGAEPPQRNGSVQYVQTDSWFVSREIKSEASSELVPTVVQSWLSPDGSQTIVETSGQRLRVDGRGLTPTRPHATATDDQVLPAGTTDPDRIEDLGPTVNDVRQELIKSAGCEKDSTDTTRAHCLYQEITGLFAQYVVPPAVASLFWKVLADEPGFRSLGSVNDRAGRAGIGISVISSDAPEFRSVLVISPSTGQLLGTEEILIKSDVNLDLKAPAINSFTAILGSEFVARRPTTS